MNITNRNECKFVGIVSSNLVYTHDYNNTSYYAFTLDVPRKSGYVDSIHIFISNDDIHSLDDTDIKIGSYYEIDGKLVNSNLKDNKDVSVLCTAINPLPSKPTAFVNEVSLSGVLLEMYPTKELTKIGKSVKTLIVKLPGDDEKVTFKVSAWNKYARYLESKFNPGDLVKVLCRLESKSRSTQPDVLLHEGSLITILK